MIDTKREPTIKLSQGDRAHSIEKTGKIQAGSAIPGLKSPR